MQKIKKWVAAHKLVSFVVLAIAVFWAYSAYQSSSSGTAATAYVLGSVQKGTLVVSVSGTGQISASNQFDVKPQVSGDIISVNVAQGQNVSAGTLIAEIDPTDAEKTIRNDEINLQSAKLSLQQLQLSSANMDVLMNNAFSAISNTFLDMPTVISDVQDIILGDDLNPISHQTNSDYYKNLISQTDGANYAKLSSIVDSAISDYDTARSDYNAAFTDYKNTSRYADQATIENLLQESIKTVTSIAQALKSEQNVLDFLNDYFAGMSKKLPATMTTYKATLKTDIGQTNTDLSNLTSIYNSAQNAPLDVKAQQLSIQQKENTLADDKANLENYYIRTPFSGVIAELDVAKGDSVSAGTVVATMINYREVANISLNEVDVSKVKLGQKVTLTFDALPNLTLTGTVTEIDTIGTVTQGVVNYNVQITVDGVNPSIKPGMSVSASIITSADSNVMLVPNSAIKTVGTSNYVQVLNPSSTTPVASSGQEVYSSVLPTQVPVTVGNSNDTMTEITSGLNEGDSIVVQTISGSSASATQTSQSSSFRIPGIGGGRFGG